MDAQSALWPLDVVVSEALQEDATLAALIHGVYSQGMVPEEIWDLEPRKSFIAFGPAPEDPASRFGRYASVVSLELHLWCPAMGRELLLSIYAHVARILHGKTFATDTHSLSATKVRFITSFPDPDRPVWMHGVCEFTAHTAVL
jgi:hypothetical protein